MRVLIGDIVSGAFPGGSALPREADLAARFGVSRGVARESVRGLEERGLVTVEEVRGVLHWRPRGGVRTGLDDAGPSLTN